eukprot:CAMPEP_0196172066 /NCGR_PEP_ID=MMETSP0911-20130528/5870_1 /TAXON_ID=49265 /ORGANISM="Thalassiosira rotula, Strain GSO102" /LENGTH=241 /DNA_ID=CAMNT_0041438999 /DNA_START=26 /DNA_END=748 /DNA_ORIENTATION=-
MSQEIVIGVFNMGFGQPLDNSIPSSNSFIESNLGFAVDAASCKSQCENIASIPVLKGFSFFDGGDSTSNNKMCRCWTDGAGQIESTDGSVNIFGHTYCYGCRFGETSLQSSGQQKNQLASHFSISESLSYDKSGPELSSTRVEGEQNKRQSRWPGRKRRVLQRRNAFLSIKVPGENHSSLKNRSDMDWGDSRLQTRDRRTLRQPNGSQSSFQSSGKPGGNRSLDNMTSKKRLDKVQQLKGG